MTDFTLVRGGSIVTMDSKRPEVEALLMRNGRIVDLGAEAKMSALAGAGAEILDLKGGVLLPGFIEAHGHPMLSAQTVGDPVVDIRALHTPTYEAVMAKIRRRVSKAKPGEVIWFTGLDQQLHEGSHEPTRDELDRLSDEVGVVIQTSNFHSIYLNAAAMRIFKVPENAAEQPGAHIKRDAQGRQWRFSETSTDLLMDAFTHICGEARNLKALDQWLWRFAEGGYTTACEPGLSPLMAGFYRALMATAPLPMRIFAYQYVSRNNENMLPVDAGDDRFGVIGTKLWGDGSVLMGNIAVTRPYLNTQMTLERMGLPVDSKGSLNYRPESLHAMIMGYARQGQQLSVHAQGDHTIDVVLDAYEAALSACPHANRPFRLEHCGLMRDDQLDRAMALGVVCSFFVPMFHFWGEAMSSQLLGPERGERFMPIGSAARRGMRASYHCDAPMTLPDALLVLYVATTRKTHGGKVLGPDQIVDIDTALRSITIDAAHHIRAEDRIGSLEPGKYADFTLLNADPRKIAPDRLRDLRVLATFVEGEQVWDAGKASRTAA